MSPAKPNTDEILAGLKDFQLQTVDYVFRRMYTDLDANPRFLIADEVGLGKTQCARGVIARAVDHLWETTPRIDVIYICSNAEIARQNIERLNISDETDATLATRLTLLPVNLRDLASRKLNFVTFTPGTCPETNVGMGTTYERALIYKLIQRAWGFSEKAMAPRNVMAGSAHVGNFDYKVDNFREEIDPLIAEKFVHAMSQRSDLRVEFKHLCEFYFRWNAQVDAEGKRRRKAFIHELRAELASQSILALEPDLIILDEFQRFSDFLTSEDDASRIARKLFRYENVRILLLSATPYKMLSLHHEDKENHYQDFLKIINFLTCGKDNETYPELVRQYRQALFALGEISGWENLKGAREQLENALRRIMVRTEKLAVSADRDGMLEVKIDSGLRLEAGDVKAFVGVQKVAGNFKQRNMIEYWKSAPYLLNFMDGYELKRVMKRGLEDANCRRSLARLLGQYPEMTLRQNDIRNYNVIDEQHPRLRALLDEVIRSNAWKLLWIPPSLPYWGLGGPFAEPALAGFTKRLIFSSWQVAPKAIASLTTYAAERAIMHSVEKAPINTPQARKKHRPLLRFGFSNDRLTGLPLLSLVYPCLTLARECSPRQAAQACTRGNTKEKLLGQFERRISELLKPLAIEEASGQVDESWYWAAPLLLDLYYHRDQTSAWWDRPALAALWGGEDSIQDQDEDRSRWADHVSHARGLLTDWQNGKRHLGAPPADLAAVLAKVAAAGLGNCMLRSLAMTGATPKTEIIDRAAKTARALLGLFNTPEAMGIIRGLNQDEPYWMRVLEYSIDGCFQAMLDEFIHLLHEGIGLGKAVEVVLPRVCEEIEQAATLRTSVLGVEHFEFTPAELSMERALRTERMRARFAMRFASDQDESPEGKASRTQQVRQAFNSPFWPFVLATTSVGQEGLDFHPYCHALVHWNLPANPVDLEQREGRIHRYKGHAVRKNLATRYGNAALGSNALDPWEALFDLGKKNRRPSDTDIVPYWVFPGEAKIQRCVPILPFSREVDRLDQLRRALLIYRMIFGQNRQEDLLIYLEGTLSGDELKRIHEDATLDLSPAP